MEQLTQNAVHESRFKGDKKGKGNNNKLIQNWSAASFYYRRMADQLLERIAENNQIEQIGLAQNWLQLADVYFAYEPIFKYVVRCPHFCAHQIQFRLNHSLTNHWTFFSMPLDFWPSINRPKMFPVFLCFTL